MNRPAGILLLAIALSTGVFAQDGGSSAGDSSARATRDTAAFVMRKSPWGAVLRSAIVPGWGQLYNESYWKIPVVLGVAGFLAYGIVTEHREYARYRDLYAASISPSRPSGDLYLKQFREYYRNNRDTYGWWFLVTYLIQAADAFVDAHLYDFDVGDEAHASLRISPSGRVSLSVSW